MTPAEAVIEGSGTENHIEDGTNTEQVRIVERMVEMRLTDACRPEMHSVETPIASRSDIHRDVDTNHNADIRLQVPEATRATPSISFTNCRGVVYEQTAVGTDSTNITHQSEPAFISHFQTLQLHIKSQDEEIDALQAQACHLEAKGRSLLKEIHAWHNIPLHWSRELDKITSELVKHDSNIQSTKYRLIQILQDLTHI
ncbi:hypothetical protein CVT24_013125 [Panaeolus cyanescens]|uniref:Uncharacterized protein n=1 Tax=Panaeolus cyanescens TaxID=181874 RepID=A0A409YNE2_9AGAR|nr:hypothetical protein CVT24_013125 [Panaeolus cyanescens]